MARIQMGLLEEWEDRTTLQRFLASQLLRGRIALVLGAGISRSFGLPTWEELIQRLYESKGAIPPPGKTLERQAEHFRRSFFDGRDREYTEAVREALYRGSRFDFGRLRRQPELAAIGALVMSSSRGSANTVITLNFDDLLELYLELHGFVTVSIGNPSHWAETVDVAIYHPNGLLPSFWSSGRACSSRLVFDQRSFSERTGKERDPVRQELITLMRTHTCLFVGLSGSDMGLDSMLLDVKAVHVADEERHLFWGVRFTDSDDVVDKGTWGERGVFCVKVDYARGLPRFLFRLCQIAAQLRRAA